MMPKLVILFAATLSAILVLAPTPWADAIDVDLELVLAVDVSSSMDMEELRLQRAGYVVAISDHRVITAIESGPTGRIALAFVEWAGPNYQVITVPWQIIDGAETAQRFANELAARPILRETDTSISAALIFASRLFAANTYRGERRVIDISGDGPNTAGPIVVPVRDAAVANGIIINGLPLILDPAPTDPASDGDLTDYYRDCVIGGPEAFVLPVHESAGIVTGIRRKLILEIVMAQPRLIQVAAFSRIKADCTLGQKDFFE